MAFEGVTSAQSKCIIEYNAFPWQSNCGSYANFNHPAPRTPSDLYSGKPHFSPTHTSGTCGTGLLKTSAEGSIITQSGPVHPLSHGRLQWAGQGGLRKCRCLTPETPCTGPDMLTILSYRVDQETLIHAHCEPLPWFPSCPP